MQMRSQSRWALLLLLLPVLLGLYLLVNEPVWQKSLRNQQFDQLQRWYPRPYTPAPVRVVDIDDESLNRLGQWPWPRTLMAQLVDRLGAAGVAAIGFDVMFAESDRTAPKKAVDLWQLEGPERAALLALPDHDEVFAKSLARGDVVLGFAGLDAPLRNGNAPITAAGTAAAGPAAEASVPEQKAKFVYVGKGDPMPHMIRSYDSAVRSLPLLEQAAKGNGALSFVPDGDGVVRRAPLIFRVGETPVGTLVSESLRVAQGATNVILRSADHASGLESMRIGAVTVPLTKNGEMWLHYSRAVKDRYVPAWKVLSNEVPAELLEGNIVLIGSSAQGLMDLRFSPMGGVMPGVEAHAQGLEQILTDHYLQRPSWATGVETLLLMLFGLLAGWLAMRTRALLAATATVLLLGLLVGSSWWAFRYQSLLIDTATPALVVLVAYIASSLWHHFSSEREQRWIKQAFSRYVSPNRVAYLVDNPDGMALGGKRQTCSFVFTDLAGFTGLMERIDPAQAVSLLNDYLDEMIAIAFRYEGTLDRIVGDAVAIMFSAPVEQADHRVRALACAKEMDAFANRYANQVQQSGANFGKTRIGVHSGEVIVGNFGGQNMFDYRALGDAVNTAARLEGVNKHLGTRMCVSEDIMADNPDVPVRPVGQLVLKGKSKALAVFEPVTEDTLPRAPLEAYTAAFNAMREGSAEAPARFAELARQWPDDPLVKLHHQRLAAGETGDRIVMNEK